MALFSWQLASAWQMAGHRTRGSVIVGAMCNVQCECECECGYQATAYLQGEEGAREEGGEGKRGEQAEHASLLVYICSCSKAKAHYNDNGVYGIMNIGIAYHAQTKAKHLPNATSATQNPVSNFKLTINN